jgi:hypothetical protein
MPVAQSILHPPCVRALIGQGEAVGMAAHGRVDLYRQACALAIAADHAPDRRLAERTTPLTQKKHFRRRFHARQFY